MNHAVMRAILDRIQEYQTIMIFRHIRLDGDCVGASKGLKAMLQATYPEKSIYIVDDQISDFLAFMGADDADVADAVYQNALGIVLDTGNEERISNQKYRLCRELIKIDHHINRTPYGDLVWVEEERSSACEMIAAFYAAFQTELTLTCRAATYIFTGMVTDSGRFRYKGVTGDTMRLAGMLLDLGIDTELLFAHLYLKDFDSLKFKSFVYDQMRLTPGGVASIYISRDAQMQFGLTFEEACSAISALEAIRGCLCWIAFIESGDGEGSIRVRLRSRFMTINAIAERYRGGGHANASGATVYSAEEAEALLLDADHAVREYKDTHEGWL